MRPLAVSHGAVSKGVISMRNIRVRGGVVGTRREGVSSSCTPNASSARQGKDRGGNGQAGSNPAPSPLLPRELVIVGQIKSGKNRILITRKGHRYPPLEFQLWRDEVIFDLVQQWKCPVITDPVRLHCQYWPGDRRTRDVSGMEDALFHVLVRAGVLKDDGLVWDCLWYRQPLNRKFPKVLITISAWAG